MGYCKNGHWVRDDVLATTSEKGEFQRMQSVFRDTISMKHSRFKPEKNRYHLYVSAACPWAHRVILIRKLKQLDKIISISFVDAVVENNGWEFVPKHKKYRDPLYDYHYLHEIYTKANPQFTGRVTVPVLWDKQEHTIVNNESADIIRILNSEFNSLTKSQLDFYPKKYQAKINKINQKIYHAINNGVYRCGFATSQAAYERAFKECFSLLNVLDKKLVKQDFLVGDQITEADWRLFTTLVRFDAVYYVHFKCNHKRIAEYPGLTAFLNRLLSIPGVLSTIEMDVIKRHYFLSHKWLNPSGLVPAGPVLKWI